MLTAQAQGERRAHASSRRAYRSIVLTLAIAAVLAGVLVRFADVRHRVFYMDEAITELRVSGNTLQSYFALVDSGVRSFADIDRMLHIDASGTPARVTASLAREDPQHPPLFYLLENLVQRVTGGSIEAARVLPLAISLIALPLIIWFCFEAFGSIMTGLTAAALLAVSPMFVNYAYQAREYGLLSVMVLLSSTLLLRAARKRTAGAWIWYGIAAALGLYTYLLFAYVILAHAVFIAIHERLRLTRTLAGFAIAAIAACASFMPWIWVLVRNRAHLSHDLAYYTQAYTLKYVLLKWGFYAGALVFDLEYASLRYALVAVIAAALVVYALWYTARTAPARAALFIPVFVAVTWLALALPDLFLHQHFSVEARYLTPTWLGLLCAVAYLFAAHIRRARSARSRAAWTAGTAVVLAAGALSVGVVSRAPVWWDNDGNAAVPGIADALSQSSRPLVIAEHAAYPFVLSMAYYVPSQVRFQSFIAPSIPKIQRRPGEQYLLDPTPRVRDTLNRAGFHLEPAYDFSGKETAVGAVRGLAGRSGHWGEGSLWRIEQP